MVMLGRLLSMSVRIMCVAWLALLAMSSGEAVAAEEVPPSTSVAMLAEGLSVDAKNHQVRMDAVVCLRRGILEYLVCRTHTFEHESIFSTNCKSSQLHLALLVIGLEPFAYDFDLEWPQRARAHTASQLTIEVEYTQDGALMRQPLSVFVINREQASGKIPDHWTFAGSVFYQEEGKEYYAADSTGAVIGVTPKGASVVQFGDRLGIPYQGENQGLEVNDKTTPLVGTQVKIIFTRVINQISEPENKQSQVVTEAADDAAKKSK
jgi:hypothetical protein